ncbi:hypothetical protein TVAG_085650 [Trichomonas vaginalis G3]|uniref:Uncharacterized protein n=1 Tax=Trichomonas vaginalis (strain ATCC PRA-98 / G3) TaxID=412133 RepID=A2F306_TRIV3|nr:proline-rich extensin signature family [Trichomonas vaginalis G3]EAY00731.1 hypothetical protein TVAG_085650 [Trichomonas vaginalis G3]KAI5498513.1 proline-rich extensin signature family [Trichomonas vaginalis G3]|eukprot:XP_001313660.1 hypothetical protein [Trichomonas vaginalis G3]
MFWLILWTSLSYQYIEVNSQYLLQNITATPGEEYRLSYPSRTVQTMYWMVFYDLSDQDTLKYMPRRDYSNDWDDPYWITATRENLEDIFHLGIPMTFTFKVGSVKEVPCRGGYTPYRNCDSGTFVTSVTQFSMEGLMEEYNIESAEHFCVIFVHKSGSFTQEVPSENRYDVTARDAKSGLRSSNSFFKGYTSEAGYTSIFLIFNLTSENPISSFDFTFTDAVTIFGTHTYRDLDDINNLPPTPAPSPEPTPQTPAPTDPTPAPTDPTPEPTPQTPAPTDPTPEPTPRTPEPTPQTPAPTDPTPEPTPRTPEPTQEQPIINPTPQTPEPTTEPPVVSTTTGTETPTPIPGVPDPTTPLPTWDGEWEEEPNVIVRGDDIPEIAETHPPIQTNYIKTEVSKVQTVVTISSGTVIVSVVVVLTVVNIVRSYKKVKDIVHDVNNSDVEDFSFSESYTLDTISDENNNNNRNPFVLSD